MHGVASSREQAALALGDLVAMTTKAALKPYVIKITGKMSWFCPSFCVFLLYIVRFMMYIMI
jgi:hypothetical protein